MKPIAYTLTLFALLIGMASGPAVAISLDRAVLQGSPSQSGSQLRGTLVRWEGTRLATSVGEYSVANVYVDDRANAKGQVFGQGKGPNVLLEFRYKRLVRVTIYR